MLKHVFFFLLKFCLIYLYSCKKLSFLLWVLLVAALGP